MKGMFGALALIAGIVIGLSYPIIGTTAGLAGCAWAAFVARRIGWARFGQAFGNLARDLFAAVRRMVPDIRQVRKLGASVVGVRFDNHPEGSDDGIPLWRYAGGVHYNARTGTYDNGFDPGGMYDDDDDDGE